ncbi:MULTISPECIES: hypothetical protein [unclassified Blastococcus]
MAIGAYVGVLALGMERTSYDVWGAMVVAPGLLLISWPLLAAAFRREDDGWVRRLIGIAFALKVLGALARWAVAFVLYDGTADASSYDARGAEIAEQFRSGIFGVDLGMEVVGTGFLIILTGVVYTAIGPTLLGGYLFFAWLGFWGLYFLYRAFCIAVPGGHHRRYALLVFLFPSMVFWSSGMGKEAFLTFCIGLATLGAARLLTGTRGAALPLALGLLGSAMVRPHMTAIAFVAVVAGFLFRRDLHRTALTPLARTVTLVVLVVAGVAIAGQAQEFLGVEDVSLQSVDEVRSETERNANADGAGSDFEPQVVNSPADFPAAALTVLFRPFPWEAGNLQALAAAAEGLVLLGLVVASWRRLQMVWRFRRGRPYVVLCLAYLLLFVYAFSTFGNFGLLARQRSLVYPFLMALVCLPTVAELRRRSRPRTPRPPPAREASLR